MTVTAATFPTWGNNIFSQDPTNTSTDSSNNFLANTGLWDFNNNLSCPNPFENNIFGNNSFDFTEQNNIFGFNNNNNLPFLNPFNPFGNFNLDFNPNGFFSGKASSNAAVNRALGQVGHRGGQSFGAGNQAWCAAFASWAYGGKNAPWGNQMSVAGIKNWAQKNGVYKKGSNFSGVKPGDLVVWRPDSCGGRSHVGIVTAVQNGKISTVEGNTSGDKVNTRTYSSGSKFDGFVRLS